MEELLPFQYIIKVSEDTGESWRFIAVFSRKVVEGEYGPIEEMTQDEIEELPSSLTGWTEYYRGVGRAFGTAPSLRIKGNKVQVSQWHSLDV